MDPEPVPFPANEVISIETTEGETSWAILLTFAPVAPISIALLPFAQFPSLEAYKAFVLLSTHALTTGTLDGTAIAYPPTAVAPIINPVNTLSNVLFISLPIANVLYEQIVGSLLESFLRNYCGKVKRWIKI